MTAAPDRRVVLVTRRTRLEELVVRHHTLAQARFYLEHLGADFTDYVQESLAYADSLRVVTEALRGWGRHQVVDRAHLPNYVFGADDIVLALGQDGLVANTLKYLDGQPLLGINPEPSRWDGMLLPAEPAQVGGLLPAISAGRRACRSVTLAEARLSDGQVLRAVNDLFIGPRTHTSALYDLSVGERTETQSSSGLIVSTGLGSTAWMRSVLTGSLAVARAVGGAVPGDGWQPMAWDAQRLVFAVREPFPSRHSQVELVYGQVTRESPLRVRSRMPDQGVIFSDGMEQDFLRFPAGVEAVVTLSATQGQLLQ